MKSAEPLTSRIPAAVTPVTLFVTLHSSLCGFIRVSLYNVDGASISIRCHCNFLSEGRALAFSNQVFFPLPYLETPYLYYYEHACCVLLFFRDVMLCSTLTLPTLVSHWSPHFRFCNERIRFVKHDLRLPFSVQGSLAHRLHQPQLKKKEEKKGIIRRETSSS